MLSLKRMNSKFIELLFLIVTFLTVCSYDIPSNSLKWTPVKFTEAKDIYNFAGSAARHYFLKQRKRDPNDIEVCQVLRVSQKGKKYKINFIANAKTCTPDIGDDCWQQLEAEITRRSKKIFTIVNVTKVHNLRYTSDHCHFLDLDWDLFLRFF